MAEEKKDSNDLQEIISALKSEKEFNNCNSVRRGSTFYFDTPVA